MKLSYLGLALSLCGCNHALYPRSAELLPAGRIGLRGEVQTLVVEPQHIEQPNRNRVDAVVGFFPDLQGNFNLGTGRCEMGLSFAPPIIPTAELRCAILQERWHDPFALSFTGAGGVIKSFSSAQPAPHARIGIEASKRVGNFVLIGNVALQTTQQTHFITTSAWYEHASLTRQEVRLAFPIGIQFADVPLPDRKTLDLRLWGGTLGVVPWIVLAHDKEILESYVSSYKTDAGFSVTFSLEWR